MRRKIDEIFSKSYFLDDIDAESVTFDVRILKTNRNIEFIDTYEY